MNEIDPKCPKCDYTYKDFNISLYSESFASYYSKSPPTRFVWCSNCENVFIIKPPFWLLRIFGIGQPKIEEMSLRELINHPLAKLKNPGMVFNCAENLLRMIWHCLLKKAKKIYGEKDAPQKAMNFAIEKLDPNTVGIMAYITLIEPKFVQLAQALAECTWTSDPFYSWNLREWIISSKNKERASIAVDVFDKLADQEN